jgi:y4mF family transcriptional regulator
MTTAMLIRKLRSERKMSQQELADLAGVSFSFVNQVEGGKQTVRLDALNKLLTVFDFEMAPNPVAKPNSIQREEIKVPEHMETSSPFEEELPPVTIHRPKNDWSFY